MSGFWKKIFTGTLLFLGLLVCSQRVGVRAGTFFKQEEISLYCNTEYKIVSELTDVPVQGYSLISSDRSVAVVTKLGRVMTMSEGSCVITAIGPDGSREECSLTVLPESTVKVALTFDDGPGAYSKELLNFLESRNIHVTYFMIGSQVSSYASQVKRMLEDGHELGNHSYTHPSLSKLDTSEINDEITKCSNAIYEAAGAYPTLMRPPYGASNSDVLQVLKDNGLPVILWNIDTLDWKYRDADYVCDQIVSGASNGNIILVHEIHRTTIDGAKAAIDILLERGVEFVTVSELLERNGVETEAGTKYYSQK